jgi:hypothetical protein
MFASVKLDLVWLVWLWYSLLMVLRFGCCFIFGSLAMLLVSLV